MSIFHFFAPGSLPQGAFRTLLLLFLLSGSFTIFGQTPEETPPTREEIKKLERRFAAQKNKSFPCPTPIDPTGCTNGDFESGTLAGSFFQGVSASRTYVPNNYQFLQCGILSGSGLVTDNNTRHVIVPAGSPEPLGLPIPVVPPGSGGNFALRLGNARYGKSVEMVTKTFVVTSANAYYTFDYAVVLEDPKHDEENQPTFRVRVYNQNTSQYVPGLVSMGPNGQDFVVPNNSSFFGTSTYEGDLIKYSQWQCATIDLSSQVGQTVTLEFINEDCSLGQHFGYTYLDNLCAGCQLPGVPKMSLNAAKSSECGKGTWCFDYSAPANVQTSIALQVNTTNGQTILTKQSPTSTGGNGQACFTLTVDEYTNLLQSGQTTVNIVAVASFSENGINLPTQFAGLADYPVKCPDYGIDPCCSPLTNTLLATLFEYEGTGNFSAPYRMKYQPTLFFNQAITNFFNYQKALDPGIQQMAYRFTVLNTDPGGPAQPGGTLLGAPGTILVDQNGPSNGGFFSQQLSVNKWYRIEADVFFRGGKTRLPKRCTKAVIDFRIQVSTNARHRIPSLELNVNGQTVRKELVGKQPRG